jgi:hypothetical protein
MYIIYKGTGGLTHMLRGIVLCIQKAKETNRKLIIDTLHHSAFKMDFGSIFFIKDLDYSDTYDGCPVSDEIQHLYAQCNQGKYWLLDKNVSDVDWNTTDEVIVYAGCGSKSHYPKQIKVVEKIKKELDEEKKINGKYIAGHFRNTDIRNDIEEFIGRVKEAIHKTGINIFYLATDDSTARDKIANAIPDIHIVQHTFPPPNIRNLHYDSKDKYKQVYECLRDFYFILPSDEFIPSYATGMSDLILDMRKHNYSFF